MHSEVAPDLSRRLSKKSALLALLSDFQWHRHSECVEAGGTRFSARVLELREEGHVILTDNVFGDVYRYRLMPPRPTQSELFA